MKHVFSLLALTLAAVAPLAVAADRKPEPEPTIWGVMGHTSGCVIFAEGRKTTGRFYGVAITTKTIGKLTVVESQDYTLQQSEYLETQENMDTLMQLAQKDHIKFVKIPEKHSPELLEKARAACKQDQ
ncbi:MAG TPA: hypothetical protein VL346_11445 [Acidobacteriaceae bacterium]|nr:hypothetical protein [Acidobacteriaceae bacterium]